MQVRLTEDEIREAIQHYLESKGMCIKVSDIELYSKGVGSIEYWRTYWAMATITKALH